MSEIDGYGYDLRTEKFISAKGTTLEDVTTVFKYIGTSEKQLAGKVAAILNQNGVDMDLISSHSGVSKRTLHRWILMNEK